MLFEIVNAMKTALEGTEDFDAVDFYDGQLIDPENSLIVPPHAFVGLELGQNEKENHVEVALQPYVYIATHNMVADGKQSMYDLMETVFALFHNKNLTTDTGFNIDRMFFTGFQEIAIVPNLSIFMVNFRIGSVS